MSKQYRYLVLGLVCVGASCPGIDNADTTAGALSTSAPKIMLHGRPFTWVRSVSPSTQLGATHGTPVAETPRSFDAAKEAAYEQYLSTLTDAEYAEKLKVVTLIGGNEYRSDDGPDLATVAQLRTPGQTHQGAPSSSVSVRSNTVAVGQIEEVSSAVLVDDRALIDNLHLPGSAIMWIHTDTTPPVQGAFSECTGSIIGPNSGISAAHCFYDEPTQTWKDFQYGATGENDLQEPNTPWGTFACFGISFYTAYTTDNSQTSRWDAAALDFTNCADDPGKSGAGFLGYWDNANPTSTRAIAGDGYLHGGAGCYVDGQICGMTGTTIVSGNYLDSTNIYSNHGMSGSPLFTSDTNLWFSGHIIATSQGVETYGLRFTSTIYALFHATDPTRFP
jgi:V8-like Glu-specific endopeptidase